MTNTEHRDLSAPLTRGDGRRDANDAIVDVGIPVYRRSAYLADAIESVLAQTLDRWRLTISDNGPGGGDVEELAERYLSDPRVSYSATGEELPVAESWTRAMQHGSAPYVALLNDDDRWHPDFLRSRIEAMEAHPECGFAFAEFVEIDAGGGEVVRAPLRFAEGVVRQAEMARELAWRCIVAPPAIVLRRSAYEAVGGAFHGWQYCDWELWARLAARFPAYYLARQDSDFRRHPRTNTLLNPAEPEPLLRMVESIETLFERELDDFRLSRITRARNRSRALLQAAGDVHSSGGWKVSGPAYRRALRTYPPTFFRYASLRMVARSILGRRISGAVAWGLRWFRPEVRARHQATRR